MAPAAAGRAATRIRVTALLTHVMGMSTMPTMTLAIYIEAVVMNPAVIPAVATVVITMLSIIPIIAVIIATVTVSSVPIASIIMVIPTPTFTIVASSTSTASVV